MQLSRRTVLRGAGIAIALPWLESMSRVISVTDLNIKTNSKATGRGSVTATCLATTFVFRQDVAATLTPASATTPGAPAGNPGGRP